MMYSMRLRTPSIPVWASLLTIFVIGWGEVSAVQFARPDGTISAGLWTAVGAATHHEAVDEVTANDDVDHIRDNANNTTAEFSLSNILDPQSSTGHIIRFRMVSGGSKTSERCDVQLWQGSTLIAATGVQNASRTAYGTFTYTLTGVQADAITNYADLRLKVITSSLTAADGDYLKVTWLEFEVPTAAMVPPTLTTPTVSSVAATTAILGATVTSDGGGAITVRGTVWNSTGAPITQNPLAEGGTAVSAFSHTRSSLPAATLIYYRGYATNAAGSGYSPDGSFYTEPSVQASGLTFSAVAPKSMQVSWTAGNGAGTIIVARQGSAVNSGPVDGVEHAANSVFGSGAQLGTGNYVVYRGSGTSVIVTNLSANTTYYFAAYQYAGTGAGSSGINYLQSSSATGSQTSSPPSPPVLSAPTATAVGTTSATLGATIDDDGAAAITSRGTVWNTTGTPVTQNSLAEGGTALGAFSHSRTGLPAATRVYFRGYAQNSAGAGYSPEGSFYTEPSTQASGVSFSNFGSSSMTVSWTPGTGNGDIVLVKSGSAVNSNPVDGTEHTANAAFGSGEQIGTGNYVVFRGSGASVNVSGLVPGTTYYIAVYELAGSGAGTSGVNYLQASPATGSRLFTGPPVLSSPSVSGVGSTSATLGATITSDGGGAILERGTCWNTTGSPITQNPLAEGGTATGAFSHLRTGFAAGSLVYFRGYARNSSGTSYSADATFYTEPATQASAVVFSNVLYGSFTVAWTRGSGDGSIVVIKKDVAVDANPTDGTVHVANTIFGSGDQLGTGNYVVYRGTSASVTVSGMMPSTTYHVAVYEYKGAGAGPSGINYLQTSPARASRLTAQSPGHNASYAVNCTDCHALHTATVPRGAVQLTVCTSCHNPTGQASAKSDVNIHTNNSTVDCGACHEIHNLGTLNYTDPHAGGATAPNLARVRGNVRKYVPAAIEPAIFQSSPAHLARTGGDAPWNGACQVCHTSTTHHTNNSNGDHTHELPNSEGKTCTECHPHANGFAPVAGNTPCVDCHTNAQGSRRAIFGEFGLASHHVKGGAVTEADCKVCHMEPDTLHIDNKIDLRDPDLGTPLTAFTALARNTSSNSLEASALTVQNGLCLKCHDANGAAAQASPLQPFSSGNTVLNINDAMSASNPSHHAVRGPGANPYCTPTTTNGSKVTMEPPWNQTANSHNVITCFDCHAVNGHGSANQRMVRGYNIDWDAIQAATNKSQLSSTTHGTPIQNFCSLCHKSSVYTGSTPEALGSVFEYHGASQSQHGAAGGNQLGCMGCHAAPSNLSGITDNFSNPRAIHGANFTWSGLSTTAGFTAQHFMNGGFINGSKRDLDRGTWTGFCTGGTCNHASQFKSYTVPGP